MTPAKARATLGADELAVFVHHRDFTVGGSAGRYRWFRGPGKACGLVEPRVEPKRSAFLWWRPHKAHRPGGDGCT
jgi:hypothetical protein